MSDKELEQEILALENEVKRLEDSTKEIIQSIKERIQNLKDIAWERESKKESSKMYKVLENEKSSTIVKSNVGDVVVDREFMEKEIHKHLDNPALRGMVTSQEMLSFPKVARNVEAKKEVRGYTWQAKANDDNNLIYGSRKYELDNEEVHRLATNHSKTESNERMAEVDRRGHPYHPIFNDFNFRKSANNESIAQNDYIIPQERKIFNEKDINKISFDERLTLLQSNQQEIANLPRASEVSIKEEEDTKHNNKLDEVKHIKRIKQ
ncbi:hypothetical protein [Helicobacter sp. UBA3407]|uniref:hypothetical protein n=1 Tax=Helicobacter TaxID=209 RepID=UPI0026216478|nr:hypothetical protein [Helicobacter sp. UBA3407]